MATKEGDISQYVDQFRQIYEPQKHWEARKQFLMNNWGDYPERQLVSLSRVWANMEFDGCEYQPELAEKVTELGAGIDVERNELAFAKKYAAELMERVRELAAGVQVKECTETSASSSTASGQHRPSPASFGGNQYQPGPFQSNLNPTQASGVGMTSQGTIQNQYQPGHFQSNMNMPQASGFNSARGNSNSLGMSGENSPQQSNRDRKRGRQEDELDVDLAMLRRFSDYMIQLLNRPVVTLSQPLNILNGASHRMNMKVETEFSATIIEVEEDGEMKRKRDSWTVSIYLGDLKLFTFNGPKGMFKNDCKNAAADAVINMLLNPRSLTINRQTKTSSQGREYNKEVVVVPLPWLKDEPEDYKIKYGAKKQKSNPVPPTPKGGDPLAHFVIQETSDRVPAEYRDVQTITNSAQANNMLLETVYSDTKVELNGEEVWLCKMLLNGKLVGFGTHVEQKKSKHVAAKTALEFLRKKCPVVKYTRDYEVDQEAAIPVQDIMHGGESSSTGMSSASRAIAEGNIGHKMLKLMGWSGQGGLGKEGEGISQPIIPIEHIRREGLGFTEKGINRDVVTHMIEQYISSGREEPLVFSSALTREERKEIHSIAHRFNLKSKSYGKDVERYLLVSNKFSLQQVVMSAAERGISSTSSGYEVQLPGADGMNRMGQQDQW